MAKTSLATANEAWGLWGTCGHNGYDQAMALAIETHIMTRLADRRWRQWFEKAAREVKSD